MGFSEWIRDSTVGRTRSELALQVIPLFVNLLLGIWDSVSDYYYFSSTNFASYTIQKSFLFILIGEPVLQLLSWTLVMGKIQARRKKTNLDAVEELKNEKSLISKSLKLLYVLLHNFIRTLWEGLKLMPLNILITVMAELKMLAFLIHYHFIRKDIVVTERLINLEKAQQLMVEETTTVEKNEEIEDPEFEQGIAPDGGAVGVNSMVDAVVPIEGDEQANNTQPVQNQTILQNVSVVKVVPMTQTISQARMSKSVSVSRRK